MKIMRQMIKKSKYRINFKAEFVLFLAYLSLFAFATILSIRFSPLFNEGVKSGLKFCFTVILPSAFPFMILSDLLLFVLRFERIASLRALFSKLFKINGYAITVFLTGLISGFPIGAKLARELYKSGKISKNECERLIGFSNNASPAFVISGIGAGLLGSVKIGVFIYLISVFSCIATGMIFAGFTASKKETEYEQIHSFSFVNSIKEATKASINICGFIAFFSVVITLLRQFIKNELTLALISSFLEVGNASRLITSLKLDYTLLFPLLSFAVSFSGLSVHLQSKSLFYDTDISFKRYYLMKLVSGIISSLASFLTLPLVI